ncbi:hypothetical protein B566_EDAN013536 [Ephemera danica]|nr:hypothetical protein B566_EDAN013536 [Ephemera danica]
MERREFSFTLDGDIYLRFLAFKDLTEFKEELKKKKPVKIDIGAIYTCSLKDKRVTQRTPVEKEFVLDIDLTDYDDVRTCCQDACVCEKCWKFLSVAVAVLDAALREDFGFQHLLWVFSGRRGIHCWVCDVDARTLSAWERGCVAQYLSLSQADSKSNRRVNLTTERLDPPTKRAVDIISKVFESIMLEDQAVLDTPKGLQYLLALIPDDTLRNECEKELQNLPDSVSKWERFTQLVRSANIEKESAKVGKKGKIRQSTGLLIEEVMLHYLYPRLDINVTTGLNHLLKAPFCIHPKTGFVCVPFNPRTASKFKPLDVPKINILLKEVNEWDEKSKELVTASNVKEYKKTSMHKSVAIFEEFVYKLAQASTPMEIM